MLKFLRSNAHWQLNQNPFAHLIAPTTTMDTLICQLAGISNSYYPELAPIDTQQTEFCLNKIALSSPKNPTQVALKKLYNEHWQTYVSLKNHFANRFLLFPGNSVIRIEKIAQLIAKCTAFCLNQWETEEILQKATDLCMLNDLEARNLPYVIKLYKTNLYCALYQNSAKNNDVNAHAVAYTQTLQRQPNPTPTQQYAYARYQLGDICALVDCFGNSAINYCNTPLNVEQRLFVYANGQNAFDTFVQSEFFANTANFASQSNSLKVQMRYFLRDNVEVRKISITNFGKKRHFQLQFALFPTSNVNTITSQAENQILLSTASGATICLVAKCKHNVCYQQNSLTINLPLNSGETTNVDICTIVAKNCADALNICQKLNCFGNTLCPYLPDSPHNQVVQLDIPLNLTMRGQAKYPLPPLQSRQLNFTYQMGDNDLATFVDNQGNSATLHKGFVFGTEGEKVFSVGVRAKQLNVGAFSFDGDKLVYNTPKSTLTIWHSPQTKVYSICHLKPTRTLIYFPLSQKSQIVKRKNGFWINQKERQLQITFDTPIESFTTNALACNTMRLRHKLDNHLLCGTCLAVTLAPTLNAQATLQVKTATPRDTPLIKESLISTYLNYANDKNIFALSQRLTPPTPLVLSAICYTNCRFVKEFLQRSTPHTDHYHTDKNGNMLCGEYPLSYALATVYYQTLVGDISTYCLNLARETLLNSSYNGTDSCIHALALKKASQLESPFKLQYLVKFDQIKKQITANPTLYQYAQAIGALPIVNPSKQRLKDLCNTFHLPQSWYYVSQLENLYGLCLSPGKISITPKAKKGLEQFVLSICGKRIDTTFLPSTTQSMMLNGVKCFLPFCPQNLKNGENQLVVYY